MDESLLLLEDIKDIFFLSIFLGRVVWKYIDFYCLLFFCFVLFWCLLFCSCIHTTFQPINFYFVLYLLYNILEKEGMLYASIYTCLSAWTFVYFKLWPIFILHLKPWLIFVKLVLDAMVCLFILNMPEQIWMQKC